MSEKRITIEELSDVLRDAIKENPEEVLDRVRKLEKKR